MQREGQTEELSPYTSLLLLQLQTLIENGRNHDCNAREIEGGYS